MATRTLDGYARVMAERGCCCFLAHHGEDGLALERHCWAYPVGPRARATLPTSAVELIPADDGASVTDFRIIGAQHVTAIYRDFPRRGGYERVGICEYDLTPCAVGLEARFPIEQIGHSGERHRLYAEVAP